MDSHGESLLWWILHSKQVWYGVLNVTMYLSLRIGILLLLRIVNCRWVVSDDAVRRQFLLGRKDLQFLKAMVQSRHIGVGWSFFPWVKKTAWPMFFTNVGTGTGDYRQRKKTSRHWRMARKQGVNNLLKTWSAQPSKKWIQSGLECVVTPNLAVKAACLADP